MCHRHGVAAELAGNHVPPKSKAVLTLSTVNCKAHVCGGTHAVLTRLHMQHEVTRLAAWFVSHLC